MSEPLIGTISMFGMNFSPRGWSYCNGDILPIAQNDVVFSLLGTLYGGDGRTTFGLPDLSSRSPLGWSMGGGAGLPQFRQGMRPGAASHILSVAQMPAHSHAAVFSPTGGGGSETMKVEATTDPGDAATPSEGAYLARTTSPGGGQDKPENIYKSSPTPGSLVSLGGVNGGGGGIAGGEVTVDESGGNRGFDLYHPSIAVTFCVAMLGVYPSRN